MRIEDFDFELPAERIAQVPAARRDDARLLVHDIAGDHTEHRHVRDLVEVLRPGDLLVLNDTRVHYIVKKKRNRERRERFGKDRFGAWAQAGAQT